MVRSMTGYGKAECTLLGAKFIIEIRSLNGKNADVNIKTSFIPREKEIEVRKYISEQLGRGTIDLYISYESADTLCERTVNGKLLNEYYNKIVEATTNTALCAAATNPSDTFLLSTILRMPDVVESKKMDIEESWDELYAAIKEAVAELNRFRIKEGESLKADVLSKVAAIESYIPQVEQYEGERVDAIRSRMETKLKELDIKPDQNRLEQEIIFYVEKLDINEEKVRLRQHCNYYRETLENEVMPGKKLGFIAQEMGREINTMGSKANHATMQQWVVRMKDELEKIKEQSLNIL